MSTGQVFHQMVWVALGWAFFTPVAMAGFIETGIIYPNNPAGWTTGTISYIGYFDAGSLQANGGSEFGSLKSSIGVIAIATGTVTITDPGTNWTIGDQLIVGDQGSGTLMIQNGGTVSPAFPVYDDINHNYYNYDVFVGNQAGSNGAAIINGQDSTWLVSHDFTVGHAGTGSLLIENGGQVDCFYDDYSHGNKSGSYIGRLSDSSGTVTVKGNGSLWSTGDGLLVGYEGSGSLSIEEGGQVASRNSVIGYYPDSYGSVTVTGAGSTWSNKYNLRFGSSLNGRLTVSEGGVVNTETLEASMDNLFGNGTININGGNIEGDLVFDSTNNTTSSFTFGSGGTINVTPEGQFLNIGFENRGSIRIAEGITIENSDVSLGYRSSATGSATVTGVGSTWDLSGELEIGRQGSATLRIENGGRVENGRGYIAHYGHSTGDVVVTGAGSVWNNRSTLMIGSSLYVDSQGTGTLTVSDGGVVNAQAIWASLEDLHGDGTINVRGAVMDEALVFDSVNGNSNTLSFGIGGTLTITTEYDNRGGPLGAGFRGHGSLRIADGVQIRSYGGYLGFYSGSSGSAIVTDSGSRWVANDDMYVGRDGSGTLRIEKGGYFSAGTSYIGSDQSSGMVIVTGEDSHWRSGNLYISQIGDDVLAVRNGGRASTNNSFIGSASDLNGKVIITGQDSTWNNDSEMYIGNRGNGTLLIENGGHVNSGLSSIAEESGSTGIVTVRGENSSWHISDFFYVGRTGHGSLLIENGGLVTIDRLCYIGIAIDSIGQVTVTGRGSKWVTSRYLTTIGVYGSGTLTINHGGLVLVEGGLLLDRELRDSSSINMANGGMLAMYGDADDSLAQFFDLIEGSDAINYWDESLGDWTQLTNAIHGVDYTLQYINDDSELDGYTLLTVGQIPEPATLTLLGWVGLALAKRRCAM